MAKVLIDNVKELNFIAKGGFGEVFLVKDKAGGFYALKKVKFETASYAKKELRALQTYQKFVENNKAENLIEILDYKINKEEISYLMPLADGVEDISPLDENWQTQTLRTYVERHYAKGEVFTKDDVLKIFLPLLETAAKLNETGIVHRDIKPDNIIFIKGKAYLADIGLIRVDSFTKSSAGTPHYVAPSWYTKNEGKDDMWGLACTLYFFLTGNSPDSMGRANYMYPSNKDKMPKEDIKAWIHFHNVVFRATREKASERYIEFKDFIESLKNTNKKEVDYHPVTHQIRTSIFWINGRIGKLYFFLCYVFMYFVANTLGALAAEDSITGVVAFIVNFLVSWFTITLMCKRIHDYGAKAYWGFLIYILPFFIRFAYALTIDLEYPTVAEAITYSIIEYASIALSIIILICLKSDKYTNKYGVPNQKLAFF